jgi:hypothetical protein
LLFHLSAVSLNLIVVRLVPATRRLDDDAHTLIPACAAHTLQQVFRQLGLGEFFRRRAGLDAIRAETARNYRDKQREGNDARQPGGNFLFFHLYIHGAIAIRSGAPVKNGCPRPDRIIKSHATSGSRLLRVSFSIFASPGPCVPVAAISESGCQIDLLSGQADECLSR